MSRMLPVVSVRVRMLTWVVATAGVGMALAGVFLFVVQIERVDARLDAAIIQEVDELRLFAQQGVDPRTGESFTAVDRLFEVAMERTVPDEGQTFLTLADGEVVTEPVTSDREFLPASLNEALRDEVVANPPTLPLQLQSLEIAGHHIRYASVPVSVVGDPSIGTYVVAYDVAGEHGEVTDSIQTYTLVSLAALLLVTLVGWIVAGRLLLPIRLLGRTAQRINDTDLSGRIPVRGNDDISDLGHTFNAMLDRIEAAFQTQRRFLDDAGHELRTPLTIVRGHLELMDPRDENDIRETRALVLDEIERMNRLVDELILLASARRPDFVSTQLVDVERLTTDVHEKASALGARTWQLDEVGEGMIRADEQRLTQALLQLAENAVKFTEPADTVALGSRVDGDAVQLWVRDTGPGVAPADAERIFERFGRGTSTHSRDGSGLGLAIVAAIAAAHGGRVELDSEAGRGATFRLVLPLAGPSTDLLVADPEESPVRVLA